MANQAFPEQDNSLGWEMPWWRHLIWIVVLLLFFWYWVDQTQTGQPQTLSYTQFKEEVRADGITSVTLDGDQVSGSLGAGEAEAGSSNFVTVLPPFDDPELMSLLEQHEVEVRAESQQTSWWPAVLASTLPWILIIGLIWYGSRVMRQRMSQADGAGGIFGFGRSKAKRFHAEESKVAFGDVAGSEGAKGDLQEIVGYLKDPHRYRKLGAKIPKGIMLMGPPGTGKTLLARAVAGEAKVPFFSISGSEFIEMFVGVGAARVRDMFERAKMEAPTIIFIDEIDSVGRARGTGLGGGHDEREQTLNQILGEMDGFAPHEAVVVLAATNRPDVLDPALMRPGRFDRKVILELPDSRGRRAILEIHCRGVRLADEVDLARLAKLTVGFSGADLENLINEAALLAGRENKEQVDMDALLSARDKVVLGAPREMVIGEEEKRGIAYHEAGHAMVASLLENADPLDKVTIIPRGRALGATEQIPEEERHNLRQSYLEDRIGVMLGGRASEQIVFGEVSSGAEEDLKQATHLARRMVTHWGMGEELGPVAFRRGEEHIFLGREMAQQRDFSEHTAQVIDAELRSLIQAVEKEVKHLLERHRASLEALAEALLEKETLDKREIQAIIQHAGENDGVRADAATA